MDMNDYNGLFGNFRRRIPEQLTRVPILAVVVIAGLIYVKTQFSPDDFGVYGHYRGSAIAEVASREIVYAGHDICVDCHDDVVDLKNSGYHRLVACETCHGPAAAHTEDPDVGQLRLPKGRGYCPLCHEYLPSRPTGFPQIVVASHNPRKPCISCHNPHEPSPPEVPEECEACHATIARTKSLSVHVYVPCVRCHDAPEEHRSNPRRYTPTKPMNREFCGGCHDADGSGEESIRKIDMATHGERYVCWQCHYPHLPEVN